MRSQKTFLLFVVLFFGLVVWMRVAPPVLAAAPDHDDFDNARFVSPLTYFDIADTREATTADDDPSYGPRGYSVWYAFTPDSRMAIEGNTFGSNYNTTIAVFTGVRGSLDFVVQNDDHDGLQSRVHFIGDPGITYYFMVSACCEWDGGSGGDLNFLIKALTPPPNDNFAQAAEVSGIPYDLRSDGFAATLEPGEPTPGCSESGVIHNSVWHVYTPPADETVSISLDAPEYRVLAVYTGSGFGDLNQVACRMNWPWYSQLLTLELQGGTTYYFQAGNPYELSEYFWFSMQPPPPPYAYFDFYPWQPSSYDEVSFSGWGDDPAGIGITAWMWDFGDGATSTEQYTTHRYAADGDYTVTYTVTTDDGRQASATQTISVRTRNVTITKFTTPKTGRVGRTAVISVGINNRRAPETVTVELMRSGPGGFYRVGELTLYVPTHKANRTTDFVFSYAFTPQDGAIGSVNFRAFARIESGPDALPGDNEAISLPVKVSGAVAAAGGATVPEAAEEMQEGFVLRSQEDENPEMRDLFLQPSYWIYMPAVDNVQD